MICLLNPCPLCLHQYAMELIINDKEKSSAETRDLEAASQPSPPHSETEVTDKTEKCDEFKKVCKDKAFEVDTSDARRPSFEVRSLKTLCSMEVESRGGKGFASNLLNQTGLSDLAFSPNSIKRQTLEAVSVAMETMVHLQDNPDGERGEEMVHLQPAPKRTPRSGKDAFQHFNTKQDVQSVVPIPTPKDGMPSQTDRIYSREPVVLESSIIPGQSQTYVSACRVAPSPVSPQPPWLPSQETTSHGMPDQTVGNTHSRLDTNRECLHTASVGAGIDLLENKEETKTAFDGFHTSSACQSSDSNSSLAVNDHLNSEISPIMSVQRTSESIELVLPGATSGGAITQEILPEMTRLVPSRIPFSGAFQNCDILRCNIDAGSIIHQLQSETSVGLSATGIVGQADVLKGADEMGEKRCLLGSAWGRLTSKAPVAEEGQSGMSKESVEESVCAQESSFQVLGKQVDQDPGVPDVGRASVSPVPEIIVDKACTPEQHPIVIMEEIITETEVIIETFSDKEEVVEVEGDKETLQDISKINQATILPTSQESHEAHDTVDGRDNSNHSSRTTEDTADESLGLDLPYTLTGTGVTMLESVDDRELQFKNSLPIVASALKSSKQEDLAEKDHSESESESSISELEAMLSDAKQLIRHTYKTDKNEMLKSDEDDDKDGKEEAAAAQRKQPREDEDSESSDSNYDFEQREAVVAAALQSVYSAADDLKALIENAKQFMEQVRMEKGESGKEAEEVVEEQCTDSGSEVSDEVDSHSLAGEDQPSMKPLQSELERKELDSELSDSLNTDVTDAADLSHSGNKSTEAADLSDNDSKPATKADLSDRDFRQSEIAKHSDSETKRAADLSDSESKPAETVDLSDRESKSAETSDLSDDERKQAKTAEFPDGVSKSAEASDLTDIASKPAGAADLSDSDSEPAEAADLTDSDSKPAEAADLSDSDSKPAGAADLTDTDSSQAEAADFPDTASEPAQAADLTDSDCKLTEVAGLSDCDSEPAEAADLFDSDRKPAEAADLSDSDSKPGEAADLTDTESSQAEAADLSDSDSKPAEAADLTDSDSSQAEAADFPDTASGHAQAADLTDSDRKLAEVAGLSDSDSKPAEAADLSDSDRKPAEAADLCDRDTKPAEAADRSDSDSEPAEAADPTDSDSKPAEAADLTDTDSSQTKAVDLLDSESKPAKTADFSDNVGELEEVADIPDIDSKPVEAADLSDSDSEAAEAADLTNTDSKPAGAADLSDSDSKPAEAADLSDSDSKPAEAADLCENTLIVRPKDNKAKLEQKASRKRSRKLAKLPSLCSFDEVDDAESLAKMREKPTSQWGFDFIEYQENRFSGVLKDQPHSSPRLQRRRKPRQRTKVHKVFEPKTRQQLEVECVISRLTASPPPHGSELCLPEASRNLPPDVQTIGPFNGKFFSETMPTIAEMAADKEKAPPFRAPAQVCSSVEDQFEDSLDEDVRDTALGGQEATEEDFANLSDDSLENGDTAEEMTQSPLTAPAILPDPLTPKSESTTCEASFSVAHNPLASQIAINLSDHRPQEWLDYDVEQLLHVAADFSDDSIDNEKGITESLGHPSPLLAVSGTQANTKTRCDTQVISDHHQGHLYTKHWNRTQLNSNAIDEGEEGEQAEPSTTAEKTGSGEPPFSVHPLSKVISAPTATRPPLPESTECLAHTSPKAACTSSLKKISDNPRKKMPSKKVRFLDDNEDSEDSETDSTETDSLEGDSYIVCDPESEKSTMVYDHYAQELPMLDEWEYEEDATQL